MADSVFPQASDWNEGSQAWKRDAEAKITSLEGSVEILSKNLRAYQRSSAAGSKATNLKISNLSGTRIRPGTPINISVYPYAYFTTSGYPAAGAHVYWGDQNDADHYEVWVRAAISEDQGIVADFQAGTLTQIASADVRGLECNSDYELMIRAVSYGGSYGFFTATYSFHTPNALTRIGPFGSFRVYYVNGSGVLDWDMGEWQVPPSKSSEATFTIGSIGSSAQRDGLGKGVLAPNGKIYYPPGKVSDHNGNTTSMGSILNPATGAITDTDFGLATTDLLNADWSGASSKWSGVSNGSGKIYWSVARTVAGKSVGSLIVLDTATETATYHDLGYREGVTDAGVIATGSSIPNRYSLAVGKNGWIYGIRLGAWNNDGRGPDGMWHQAGAAPVGERFLTISPAGAVTKTGFNYLATVNVGKTPTWESTSGFPQDDPIQWEEACADANGNVWFFPNGINTKSLKLDVNGAAPQVFEREFAVPGSKDNQTKITGTVLHPNGSIYVFGYFWNFATGWSRKYVQVWPDGNQTVGSINGFGYFGIFGSDPVIGSDDKIYCTFGFDSDMFLSFTPSTGNTEVHALATPAADIGYQFQDSTMGADGKIYMRLGQADFAPPGSDWDFPPGTTFPSDRYLVVAIDTTDYPGVPWPPDAMGNILPNNLKEMRIERSEDGINWDRVGSIIAEGLFADPTIEPGKTYQYKLTPVSTAGIDGYGTLGSLEVPTTP